MGFKKRLKYRMMESALSGAGIRRLARKTAITALVLGLVLFVGCVLMLGYSIDRAGKMMSSRPDADLAALRQLVAEKVIILTEKQKAELEPVLRELAKTGQAPQKAAELKEKILAALDASQLKEIKAWKDRKAGEAANLLNEGKASMSEAVSRYWGIPAEKAQGILNGLAGWWQLNRPQDGSAEKLLQELEAK